MQFKKTLSKIILKPWWNITYILLQLRSLINFKIRNKLSSVMITTSKIPIWIHNLNNMLSKIVLMLIGNHMPKVCVTSVITSAAEKRMHTTASTPIGWCMLRACATPATQIQQKADGSVRTLSWQTCSGSKMSYLPSSTQRWSIISKIEKTSKSTEISANRSEPTEVAKSFSTR